MTHDPNHDRSPELAGQPDPAYAQVPGSGAVAPPRKSGVGLTLFIVAVSLVAIVATGFFAVWFFTDDAEYASDDYGWDEPYEEYEDEPVDGGAPAGGSGGDSDSPPGTEFPGFIDIEDADPGPVAEAGSLDEAEVLASQVAIVPDEDGAYLTVGLQITRLFGVDLAWRNYTDPGPCGQRLSIEDDAAVTVAWYCTLDPNVIRLNLQSDDMPFHLYEPQFIDTVKHELAHFIIDMRCGTTDPLIAGDAVEGVTNSYAVIYLDADYDELQSTGGDFPEYLMTDATDAAARDIHDGIC